MVAVHESQSHHHHHQQQDRICYYHPVPYHYSQPPHPARLSSSPQFSPAAEPQSVLETFVNSDWILFDHCPVPEPVQSACAQMADEEAVPGLSGTKGGDNNGQPTVAISSRVNRKLARAGSKPWFNKSFDQSVLDKASKPSQPRPMRRQNSVTDFFQTMLNKSKSHLQDIFTSRKEKSRLKSAGRRAPGIHTPTSELQDGNEDMIGAEGGTDSQTPEPKLYPDMRPSSLHNSCPDFGEDVPELRSPGSMASPVSLNPDPNPWPKDKRGSVVDKGKQLTSPSHLTTSMNMFMVSKPPRLDSMVEMDNLPPHRPVVKKSSLPFSMSTSEGTQLKSKSPGVSSLPSPSPSKIGHQSSSLSPVNYRPPRIVTLSSVESSDSTDEGSLDRRNVSSAPPSRQSVCSAWSVQSADDLVSRSKRSLVKSNSDTFARLSSSPQHLSKASSDGNCFKKSPTSSLASSVTSQGNVMISVTDYLFLGSIEAAYNEPLLCKYNISSLVDMTNISPTLVPTNKKTDCPCACVNKTHFRSKLNIGVDDIEWENLEQYFEEINAFIHGARRKDRRVLVFSYMGQSRAAAAVIQHLMHHFKMPYQEAMKIVRAKRPQIKLNSGFVKALRRLEKRLGVEESEREVELSTQGHPAESPIAPRGSVEEMDTLWAPPVVKGAWLEC